MTFPVLNCYTFGLPAKQYNPAMFKNFMRNFVLRSERDALHNILHSFDNLQTASGYAETSDPVAYPALLQHLQ